jgi:DNA modification methylase
MKHPSAVVPGLFDARPTFGEAAAQQRSHRGPNRLNDLDPKEWLKATKSAWYDHPDSLERPALIELTEAAREKYGDERAMELLAQILPSVLLSRPTSRDSLKAQHPATFAEEDIARLISFFTKSGNWVLDPFLGSGSTLVACKQTGRNGVGIEITRRWAELATTRLHSTPSFFDEPVSVQVKEGDAKQVLREIRNRRFDFVLTSPPYWSMLNKKADHKVKRERVQKGLATTYSSAADDLGNCPTYGRFLSALKQVFAECKRVLKPGGYIAIVVSDFRDKSKFYLFHADLARVLERLKYQIAGITILVQDAKTLYPYGMPHAFVSNIHHQYVVVARKPSQLP